MNITDVLLQVVTVLDRLGVPYVVVGSLASSARGFPRTTNGADIVADLRSEHPDPLVAAQLDLSPLLDRAHAEAGPGS